MSNTSKDTPNNINNNQNQQITDMAEVQYAPGRMERLSVDDFETASIRSAAPSYRALPPLIPPLLPYTPGTPYDLLTPAPVFSLRCTVVLDPPASRERPSLYTCNGTSVHADALGVHQRRRARPRSRHRHQQQRMAAHNRPAPGTVPVPPGPGPDTGPVLAYRHQPMEQPTQQPDGAALPGRGQPARGLGSWQQQQQ